MQGKICVILNSVSSFSVSLYSYKSLKAMNNQIVFFKVKFLKSVPLLENLPQDAISR